MGEHENEQEISEMRTYSDGQDAANLKIKIVAALMENKIDLCSCVAQCYDGASVMSGNSMVCRL